MADGSWLWKMVRPLTIAISLQPLAMSGCARAPVDSPPARNLPTSVRLPNHIFNTDGSVWQGQDGGMLGHSADPWLFRCEPAAPSFHIPEFSLAAEVSVDRLGEREHLLQRLDRTFAVSERGLEVSKYDRCTEQAFDLLRSPEARAAFDLGREAETVRARYGRHQFGQSCLLARRLVEAGVGLVQRVDRSVIVSAPW